MRGVRFAQMPSGPPLGRSACGALPVGRGAIPQSGRLSATFNRGCACSGAGVRGAAQHAFRSVPPGSPGASSFRSLHCADEAPAVRGPAQPRAGGCGTGLGPRGLLRPAQARVWILQSGPPVPHLTCDELTRPADSSALPGRAAGAQAGAASSLRAGHRQPSDGPGAHSRLHLDSLSRTPEDDEFDLAALLAPQHLARIPGQRGRRPANMNGNRRTFGNALLVAFAVLALAVTGSAQTVYLNDGALHNAQGTWDLPAQGTCPTAVPSGYTGIDTRPECVALRLNVAQASCTSANNQSWTTGGVCNDLVNNTAGLCATAVDRLWNPGTGVCAIVMADDDRNNVTCAKHGGTWYTGGTCTGNCACYPTRRGSLLTVACLERAHQSIRSFWNDGATNCASECADGALSKENRQIKSPGPGMPPNLGRQPRERWIPLENRYFEALDILSQCDLVVDAANS